MSSTAGYIVETFVTLLAVCAIAFVVLYGARRLGAFRAQGPIHLVGHLPLEGRRSIYLVKVGTQVLVVGSSEAGISRLGDLPADTLGPLASAPRAPFADVLAGVMGKKARPSREEARDRAGEGEG